VNSPLKSDCRNRDTLRFGVAVLLAAAGWIAFLAHVRWLVGSSEPAAAPAAPLEMRVIELPAARSADEASPHEAKPVEAPPIAHHEPTPVRRSPARSAPRAMPLPHPVPDGTRELTAAPHEAAAPQPAPQEHTDSPSTNDSAASSKASASASGPSRPVSQQARLLSQPLPDLPDDLREQGYQAVAVARFTVHANGSFDVELVKPTQNPRLNQILLATLRLWRFFPALEEGRPVESHQDVRVHFNID
jgi:protein TonB